MLLGAYGGAVGVVLHRQRSEAFGLDLPWGLALVIVLALLIALTAQSFLRFGSVWSGGGWLLPTLLMQLGEDVWIGDDAIGWLFLLVPLACFAVIAWWSVNRTVRPTS